MNPFTFELTTSQFILNYHIYVYSLIFKVPKKLEKKNNLITKFFKSPPSQKEIQSPEKESGKKGNEHGYESGKPSQKGVKNQRTDAHLNSSLSDFETSSVIKPVKISPKQYTQKIKRDSGKKNNSKEKSKKNKDKRVDGDTQRKQKERGELPKENFLNLKLCNGKVVADKQDKKEQDVKTKKNNDVIIGKIGLAEKINLNESREISYEDFLKSDHVEREDTCIGNNYESESEPISRDSKHDNYQHDSFLLVNDDFEEFEKKKSSKKKGMSGSFFTILPSRQFVQKERGQKVPVVITVSVPDSPADKGQHSNCFGIFDKPRTKLGFEKCTDNNDDATAASRKTTIVGYTEESSRVKKNGRNLEIGGGKARRGRRNRSVDVSVQIEDYGINEECKIDDNDVIVKHVEKDEGQQRKRTANKLAILDKIVAKPTGKTTQSTLCFGKGGLTAMKSPSPSLVSEVKETEKTVGKYTNTKNKSETDGGWDSKKSSKGAAEYTDQLSNLTHKQRKKSRITGSESEKLEIEKVEISKQRKKRKRTCKEKCLKEDIEVLEVKECNRSSKTVYSSEILESPTSMKWAPIKMRLTRQVCKYLSSLLRCYLTPVVYIGMYQRFLSFKFV